LEGAGDLIVLGFKQRAITLELMIDGIAPVAGVHKHIEPSDLIADSSVSDGRDVFHLKRSNAVVDDRTTEDNTRCGVENGDRPLKTEIGVNTFLLESLVNDNTEVGIANGSIEMLLIVSNQSLVLRLREEMTLKALAHEDLHTVKTVNTILSNHYTLF
jgi:hypothetical protein